MTRMLESDQENHTPDARGLPYGSKTVVAESEATGAEAAPSPAAAADRQTPSYPVPRRPHRARKVLISIVTRVALVVLAIALGFGAFFALVKTAPNVQPQRFPAHATVVGAMRPAAVEVRRQYGGFGTALAMETADVPAEVNAVVEPIPETTLPGVAVSAGDVLIILDKTDFEEEVDRIAQQIAEIDARLEQLSVDQRSAEARAALAAGEVELAERDLARIQELYDQGDAKDFELEEVQSRVFSARRMATAIQAELDAITPRELQLESQRAGLATQRRIAERNIDRATITAPIAGVIESVDVEQGEQVRPGDRVVRLVDLRRIEVPIRLPGSARPHVQLGDAATLTSTGDDQRRWQGRVLRIGPTDDAATRTFPVYIEVLQRSDAAALLAPGSYVEGLIRSASSERRFVIPRRSIEDNEVFLVEGERVREHSVVVDYWVNETFPELNLPGEDYWAVLAQPLPPDTLVVLNGAADLSQGQLVRPVTGSEAAEVVRDDDQRPRSGGNGGAQ